LEASHALSCIHPPSLPSSFWEKYTSKYIWDDIFCRHLEVKGSHGNSMEWLKIYEIQVWGLYWQDGLE
jgi:hypothetical protein